MFGTDNLPLDLRQTAALPTMAQEEVEFGPELHKIFCTVHECGNEHRWPAQLALAKCPGCSGQILAVRLQNCPMCNEPIAKTSIRTDLIYRDPVRRTGMPIVAMCQGQVSQGEVQVIELMRTLADEAEEGIGGVRKKDGKDGT